MFQDPRSNSILAAMAIAERGRAQVHRTPLVVDLRRAYGSFELPQSFSRILKPST
jgi:hypothetical protein